MLELNEDTGGSMEFDDDAVERMAPYRHSVLMKAWEDFLTAPGRAPNSGVVRNVIESSWTRSSLAKVDAHGRGSRHILASDQLEALRDTNQELLTAAEDTATQSGALLEDSGAMLIITDKSGVILSTIGDPRIIHAAEAIHLEAGADWGERAAGTNGIGTAIFTGKPVYVHAAEHYCEGVKTWTCAGAPIRSPIDGEVIGLIDISGPPEIFRRHNIVLSVVAASQIELALAKQAALDKAQLLESCLARLPGQDDRKGLVLLDRRGRIVHFDQQAVSCWKAVDSTTGPSVGQRLADFERVRTDSDIHDRLPMKLRDAKIEALLSNGTFAGAFLILRDAARIARPARPRPPVNAQVQAARAAIVGRSDLLLDTIDRVERAATASTSILLEGETGVGKELFARLVHACAETAGPVPFVAMNCGAISKDILGGELFGHAPGAFTGATREGRPGRFEVANGGVLSLDEIGEMPLDLQPYLLRVLEEKEVYRLGDTRPRPIDVRLVASTNRSLKQEVAEGRFRKDLYYRIGVIHIVIPPLRERAGDIELLLDHFSRRLSAERGVELLRFGDDALECLRRYGWPGNVRELRNLVETLSIMASDPLIRPADLPSDITAPAHQRIADHITAQGGHYTASFDEEERKIIEHAMEAANGNMSRAAHLLGLSRSTIYRKLRSYKSSDD
ncbi:sigma-54-dependent Fis family transcriptional regulator [Taklimakanibacter deserti]|uniref:sigma-54-dependent Fis family transcriptional regulator n=1 Tax=Taklimakanibacter deserti TaxID=2267839 RepID=UPI0013C501EA